MNGGGAKVPIPNSVRKMIQDIKEIARNASDDEIHGMLKECGMDPNEATQRLLTLDSFQEVKSKRDKRKENLNKDAVDSNRRPVTQGRGGKVYKGNFVSRVSNDSVGGKNSSSMKDNLNKGEKNHFPSFPVTSEARRRELDSSSPASGMTNGIVKARYDNAVKKHPSSEARSSARFITVGKCLLPVPNPKTEISESSRGSGQISMKVGVPSSAEGSSSSGPRVVTGTVKREVRAQPKSGDNKRLARDVPVANVSSSAEKVTSESGEPLIQGKAPIKSATTDRNQAMELPHSRSSSRPSSNYSNRSQQSMVSQKGVSSKEWKPKSANSNVVQAFGQFVISDASLDEGGDNSYSLRRTSPDESKQNALKLQKKFENLTEHVIIPQHLHVPESERGAFSFGSFDVNFEVEDIVNNLEGDTSPALTPELSHASEENADEPSLGEHVPLGGDNEGQELLARVPDSTSTEEINSLSTVSSELHYDQPKQDSTPFGGPQSSAVQISSGDSNLGLITPVVSGQFPGLDNSDHQIRDASRLPNVVVPQPFDFSSNYYAQMYRAGVESDGRFSPFFASSAHQNSQTSHQENGNPLPTPLTAQPTGLLQSSMAMAQQPISVFRQPPGVHLSPYPQNYMPLNYFSPFYVPSMHHFMGNATFPQQPPAGSVFPPSVGGTNTGKYPLPQYKPGNTAVNQSHILPTGYGPYTSTVAGYGPSIPAATTSNLTGSEDGGGSQYKDNNTGFIPGQQGEGSSTMWVSTPGRDLSGLPIGSFYNLSPQGQHVTFAPSQVGHSSFAGLYHPAQSVTAATAHPLLQQSQTMAAVSEMVGPPSGGYQQRPQFNWANGY